MTIRGFHCDGLTVSTQQHRSTDRQLIRDRTPTTTVDVYVLRDFPWPYECTRRVSFSCSPRVCVLVHETTTCCSSSARRDESPRVRLWRRGRLYTDGVALRGKPYCGFIPVQDGYSDEYAAIRSNYRDVGVVYCCHGVRSMRIQFSRLYACTRIVVRTYCLYPNSRRVSSAERMPSRTSSCQRFVYAYCGRAVFCVYYVVYNVSSKAYTVYSCM